MPNLTLNGRMLFVHLGGNGESRDRVGVGSFLALAANPKMRRFRLVLDHGSHILKPPVTSVCYQLRRITTAGYQYWGGFITWLSAMNTGWHVMDWWMIFQVFFEDFWSDLSLCQAIVSQEKWHKNQQWKPKAAMLPNIDQFGLERI